MNSAVYTNGKQYFAEDIQQLEDHIEGLESERDLYLQYFDYIGVDPVWVHTFVHTLNDLDCEIVWETN